jgi:hypothetical protein
MLSSKRKFSGIALVFIAIPAGIHAQNWAGLARDAQHSNMAGTGAKTPGQIRWSRAVDLNPQYNGGDLLIHYGSPLITRVNTLLIPIKTGATDGFQVEARRAADGSLIWTYVTDYTQPSHNWTMPLGMTLTPKDRYLVIPAAGGTIIQRTFPDSAAGGATRVAFYGIANYNSNPAAFNSAIKINTPITSDKLGNLYFGFVSTGAALPGYPSGIPSGLARVSSSGVGSFVSAAALSADPTMIKVVHNSAPALSNDESRLYVAVSDGTHGCLNALTASTLVRQATVYLRDPSNNGLAWLTDDSSSTPTVAPDGDVYYGVLEANFASNHDRGWLLHFSGDLASTKLPSAFGWDDTASIVPVSLVPSYSGPSTYLLLTKYNDYFQFGSGLNKLALVDPNVSMTDPVTGTTVMNTFLTVLGVTPDPEAINSGHPGAVREWCINSAAIDPVTRSAVVNSEDGAVYRWDFTTNSLMYQMQLALPTGEAYTSTLIGPDGAIYATNNATLFSVSN